MGRHKLFYYDSNTVRDYLNEVIELSERIHALEKTLIEKLGRIDQHKYFIRYGYKSLSGFVQIDLKFSKTQTQRIVTQVRRSEPTDKIMDQQIRWREIQKKLAAEEE